MNLDEQHFLQNIDVRIREHLGWTQAELGERCELHGTFIGSVERGERNLALLNLRKIARVLRMSLKELLTEKPPEEDAKD